MTYSFASEQEAAQAMLLEVAGLLNRETIDYAVIGGWIPYLFNAKPIRHTGTYDVDIILNAALSKEHVIRALDSMVKDSGYMRAPKNAFQVYRKLVVNNEPMIFHVDFLHRKYADDSADLIMQWGRYESIATPGTDVIFTEKEARYQVISGLAMDGTETFLKVPFATEAGFLSSKGRSVGFGKRLRDAFDIFLIINQSNNIAELTERSQQLMKSSIFAASMARLEHEFNKRSAADDAAAFIVKLAPEHIPGFVEDADKAQLANTQKAKEWVLKVVNEFLTAIKPVHRAG
ncbi:hypothetical protein [Pseudomonas sp. MF4836]|uniref:hypothetical protein n=1 Tax=Pseudomonas sp. MF4836 TaxID=1960827 RepID=UPI000997C434|nr:hypothetical protein [Pseudomonas sp. MF4836]OOV92441.1 hypothetical protein MF4836_23835 [Pseudomonas sp. MF4836]